ncbi:hypothetical protein N8Z79_05930 [Crocinitomicaceae bacterium]|nr:hypothetical protein [Crocinitomicaceae bacterium]
MKVHLIRSEGFKMEDYNHVFNILNQYTGGITFVPSEPILSLDSNFEISYESQNEYDIQKKSESDFSSFHSDDFTDPSEKLYTWGELLSICNEFRVENNIPDIEQVLLLTEKKNDQRFFGGFDPITLNNFFIDCSEWDDYFKGFDVRFPIAFSIAGWLMRKVIFASAEEGYAALHKEPRGCFMDYCIDKREIKLQMRTADICDTCLSYSEKNDANRVYMNQLIQIMEGVRLNLLFRDRSKYLRTNSRLEFREQNHHMFLTDLGDLQVNLNPKERALYLLYMRHPEGISRTNVVDYKNELKSYYKWLSNSSSSDQIKMSVDLLVDASDDNFIQVLSRIRRKFKDTVGQEQYKTYSIESYDGIYKITLDRELISFDEKAKFPSNNIYK